MCASCKGIRAEGNALSCVSPHLSKEKTCKERGNRPERLFDYADVLTPFAALTRKGLKPRHVLAKRSVAEKQLFLTSKTRNGGKFRLYGENYPAYGREAKPPSINHQIRP